MCCHLARTFKVFRVKYLQTVKVSSDCKRYMRNYEFSKPNMQLHENVNLRVNI